MAEKMDIEKHYDLNERVFFEKILGKSMTYSCADWRQCGSLHALSEFKYHINIIQKSSGVIFCSYSPDWNRLY